MNDLKGLIQAVQDIINILYTAISTVLKNLFSIPSIQKAFIELIISISIVCLTKFIFTYFLK